MNPSRSSVHRDDIDGLRCLAILPVVLFHLQVHLFNGGYVGVDIFFVISGYLITAIVARDIRADRFSFVRFYERRVRRIAPALVAMLACVSVVAVWLLAPIDLKQYGVSLVATLFSFSNLYFWTQSSYFSPTFFKLLLHTWSLSVEEQFYLVLPITIFLLRNRWNRMRGVLIVIFLVSFAISCWMSEKMPTAAFFAPWSRVWELLIGSLLALFPTSSKFSKATYNILGIVGLVMTLWAMIRFGNVVRFPAPLAIVPCLGAALMIFSGEHGTVVGRVLSWPPFVFVGRISYSVYLVHWPLLLLAPIVALPGGKHDSIAGKCFLLLLSLALGAASWRYIETPFRVAKDTHWTSHRIWGGYAIATTLLLAGALGLIVSSGLPYRFPKEANHLLSKEVVPETSRLGTCFITTSDRFQRDFKPHDCTDLDPTRKNYLILGDSHAAAMWHPFVEQMPWIEFQQINSSGCLMIPGSYDVSNCGLAREFTFEQYLPVTKPDLTMLVQRWTSMSDVKQLASIAAWFRAHQEPLLIVGPTQEYSEPLAYLVALSERRKDNQLPQHFERRSLESLDTALAAESARLNVPYLSLREPMCKGVAYCTLYADGDREKLVMLDDSHLTPDGARMAIRYWINHGQLSGAGAFTK